MKIRSAEELLHARERLADLLQTKGISEQQKVLFFGMITALVWASGDPAETMERLVRGEPIAPGQTAPVPEFRK